MFNKLSAKTLISVFIILLIIVLIFVYFDGEHGERTFKTNLVDIDTSAVTSIQIYPEVTNHKRVKIYKDGKEWKVLLPNNKSAIVPKEKVDGLFRELNAVKANNLASTDESKWKEFKVDSSGIEVQVYEGNNKTLDLIIGKFEYHKPNTMISFVRIQNENEIYGVNGFLNFAFNHDQNYFRDNRIINDYYSNWKKLTFTYPGDSSFVLEKNGKIWKINNSETDSSSTAKYLSSISNLTNQNIVDDVNKNDLNKVKYHLTIESSSKGVIEISAFQNNIINSSQNNETYFNGNKTDLLNKIFVKKDKFFKK